MVRKTTRAALGDIWWQKTAPSLGLLVVADRSRALGACGEPIHFELDFLSFVFKQLKIFH
jgi:hypothetical protein